MSYQSVICQSCKGSGKDATNVDKCPRCLGRGMVCEAVATSATPRTEAVIDVFAVARTPLIVLARQLERELNAASAGVKAHCADWAADDTRVKAIAKSVGIDLEAERAASNDDSFPSVVEVAERMAALITELKTNRIDNTTKEPACEDVNPVAPLCFWDPRCPETGWLSNFYVAGIYTEEWTWATSEHYYQSLKSNDAGYVAAIRACLSAKDAKRCSHKWFCCQPPLNDRVKYMRIAIRAKFSQHKDLADKLLATRGAIIEASPVDNLWGIGVGDGINLMGLLLEELRSELQAAVNKRLIERQETISELKANRIDDTSKALGDAYLADSRNLYATKHRQFLTAYEQRTSHHPSQASPQRC